MKKSLDLVSCITVDEARDIPIGDILEPWIKQRVVDTSTVEYMAFRDGIEAWGLIHPIVVRPKGNKVEVIVGCRRRQACIDLGWSTIPCIVRHGVTDEDVRELQIEENGKRQDPTLLDYCRQLKQIMGLHPGIKQRELANRLHQSPHWVRNVLKLEDLPEASLRAVERGEVSLEAGYYLSKIPEDQQPRFLAMALTSNAKNFRDAARKYIKESREAMLGGHLDRLYRFKRQPTAYLRTPKELKAELKEPKVGPTQIACMTGLEIWCAAVKWMLHLDPESIKDQRDRYNAMVKSKILQKEDEPCDS